MSHLIKIYTVCPLVFEFSKLYSLALTLFENLLTKILSSALVNTEHLGKLLIVHWCSFIPYLRDTTALADTFTCTTDKLLPLLIAKKGSAWPVPYALGSHMLTLSERHNIRLRFLAYIIITVEFQAQYYINTEQ